MSQGDVAADDIDRIAAVSSIDGSDGAAAGDIDRISTVITTTEDLDNSCSTANRDGVTANPTTDGGNRSSCYRDRVSALSTINGRNDASGDDRIISDIALS